MTAISRNRIESIDVLRGIVMVIMALDHVRDYFYIGANTVEALDIVNYNLPLFFTRWITHFCAPVFIFLSGTSIYLQGLRKTNKELGIFVIKRGLWLIFAECSIVAFAWTFNPNFTFIPFQVIWAIGISMVLLGALLFINSSYKTILVIGSIIVFGHNALDFVESAPGYKGNVFLNVLHSAPFTRYTIFGNHNIFVVYPFLAWTGLMLLGYCFGKLFEQSVSSEKRIKQLRLVGSGLLIAFVLLRFTNWYGDPNAWTPQPTFIQSLLSFIKVCKYPPSLLFMFLTIGSAMIILSFLEPIKNKFTALMTTFGRTAFFYYILHLYLIHLIAVAFYFINGNTMDDIWNVGKHFPFLFVVPGQGFHLPGVYIIWIAVIVALYPLCKWYDAYKTKHREKWWLSYL